jgi:hypothetical protein
MTAAATAPPANRWASARPDAVAFAIGIVVAWWQEWNTTDLVWSLWLSSLLVGYAMIIWNVSAPLRELIGGIAADHSGVARAGAKAATLGLVGAGTLFGLAFFAVHFGGFHYVHSVFLSMFFPLAPAGQAAVAMKSWPGLATYLEVLQRYWWFVPAAAIAERAAFRTKPAGPPDIAVTPAAIARRKANAMNAPAMAPYRNVIRMHLLIFFFAFAHFAKLENFAVYAVVYAVYFFPWRLLRRPVAVAEEAG